MSTVSKSVNQCLGKIADQVADLQGLSQDFAKLHAIIANNLKPEMMEHFLDTF